jgi:hypothetical protein
LPTDSDRSEESRAPDDRNACVTLGADNAVESIDLIDRKVNWSVPVGSSPDDVWYGPTP